MELQRAFHTPRRVAVVVGGRGKGQHNTSTIGRVACNVVDVPWTSVQIEVKAKVDSKGTRRGGSRTGSERTSCRNGGMEKVQVGRRIRTTSSGRGLRLQDPALESLIRRW